MRKVTSKYLTPFLLFGAVVWLTSTLLAGDVLLLQNKPIDSSGAPNGGSVTSVNLAADSTNYGQTLKYRAHGEIIKQKFE